MPSTPDDRTRLRPAVRPGAPVLRRDANHLQIGTSPGVVVADRPGLLALIRSLDGKHTVDQLEVLMHAYGHTALDVRRAVAELAAAGALSDQAPSLTQGAHPLSVWLEHDPQTREFANDVAHLLDADEINVPAPSTWGADVSEIAVIVTAAEGPRSRFENASLMGTAYLVVTADERTIHIGPLVIPGRSPCVTCLDLHRTDFEAAWPALIAQLGHPLTPMRPPEISVSTRRVAAAHVVEQLGAFARGDRECVVGGRLSVGPTFDQVRRYRVAFHPACACNLLILPR